MAVYVDDARHNYGRMIMCHMLADTEEELHEMADKICVSRHWYQKDHYDICMTKWALARECGVVNITERQAVEIRRKFREKLK